MTQAVYGEPQNIQVVLTGIDGRQYIHTPLVTDLEIETASDGGEMSASWSIAANEPYGNVLPDPPAEVELIDQGGRFRHLRLEKPSGDFKYREAQFSFVARGFSSHGGDDVYSHSQVFLAGTPLEDLVAHALNELCPQLDSSRAHIAPTGVTLTADSQDFGGKSAKAVWNAAAALGGFHWHVWSQESGRPYLETRLDPAEADYIVRLSDQADASLGWDLQNLYNRVLVKWSEGYEYADDMTSQGRFHLRRTWFVDKSSELTTAEEANSLANQLIRSVGSIPPDGLGLTLDYGVPLWTPLGAQVPLWRANAGRRVTLEGLLTESTNLAISFICQQTIFNNNQLTLVPAPQDALTDLAMGSTRTTSAAGGGSAATVSVISGGGSSGGGSSGTVGGYVVEEREFGLAASPGSSSIPAARDHTHGTPDDPGGSAGQYRALVLTSPDGIHVEIVDDGAGNAVTVLMDLE